MGLLPDLTCLTKEQLAKINPAGWVTSCDRGYSAGGDRSAVKHWQHVPLPDGTEERIFFWHEREECEFCDVCMNRFEGALKELNDQIIQSYNMPSLILGNSNLTGVGAQPGGGSTGRIASRKSAFSYGTGSTFGGEYAPEYSYPIARGYGNKDFSMTPKELAAVDKARGHSGTREKTPQELYDEAWHKFVDAPDTDVALLEPMLAQVSDDVTGLSERPCDERPEFRPFYVNPWYWTGAGAVLLLVLLVMLL